MKNFNVYTEFAPSYSLCVIMLNLFIYTFTLILLFNIFFFFNLNKYRTLTDIKNFFMLKNLNKYFLWGIFFFAGLPPFSGFVGKFLIFETLITKFQFLFFIFFFILNLFAMYFYLQNAKYLITKKNHLDYKLIYTNKKNSSKRHFSLIFFLFLNIFFIFFLSDILIFLNLWTFFI